MTTPAVPCVLGSDVVAAINDGGSVLDRLARRRSSARIYPTWLAAGSTEPEERCEDATAHPAHLWAPEPGPGGSGTYVCPGTPPPSDSSQTSTGVDALPDASLSHTDAQQGTDTGGPQ